MIHFNTTTYETSTEMQRGSEWQSRWDWETMSAAQDVAAKANAKAGYRRYLAVDRGAYVAPRFDVIEMPRVGDEVSHGFNGDYYPDGTIVSISKSLKVITTSTGTKYYRKRESGRWASGTWTLIRGHRTEQNPHF